MTNSTRLTIQPPPPCQCCGASPLADHAKDCNQLAAMHASAYPCVLDDNGIGWETNLIRKLRGENMQLREALIRAVDAVEQGWDSGVWIEEAREALNQNEV